MIAAVLAEDLGFAYPRGAAFRVPRWRVEPGQRVGLSGPSGVGKSTLLELLAGLAAPFSGELTVGGAPLHGASARDLAQHRRTRVAYLDQDAALIDALPLIDNVLLPARLAGPTPDPAHAARALSRVGLAQRLHDRPPSLSAGERQRVAVARALWTRRPILLADEPTTGLDAVWAREVIALLLEGESTVIVASHDPVLLDALDVVYDVARWRLG